MTESAQKNFGIHFKKLLKEAGLSQSALARESGVDRSRINRLANGKVLPSEMEIGCLPKALGVSPKVFLDPLGGAPRPPTREEARRELSRLLQDLEAAKADAAAANARANLAEEQNRRLEAKNAELQLHLTAAKSNVRRLEEEIRRHKAENRANEKSLVATRKQLAKAKTDKGGEVVAAFLGLMVGTALGGSSSR